MIAGAGGGLVSGLGARHARCRLARRSHGRHARASTRTAPRRPAAVTPRVAPADASHAFGARSRPRRRRAAHSGARPGPPRRAAVPEPQRCRSERDRALEQRGGLATRSRGAARRKQPRVASPEHRERHGGLGSSATPLGAGRRDRRNEPAGLPASTVPAASGSGIAAPDAAGPVQLPPSCRSTPKLPSLPARQRRSRRLPTSRCRTVPGVPGPERAPAGPHRSRQHGRGRADRARSRSLWFTGPFGAWRSLVARTVRVGEVPGSNPGAPIFPCKSPSFQAPICSVLVIVEAE